MAERLTRGRAVSEVGPLATATGGWHLSRCGVLGSSHAPVGRTLAMPEAHTLGMTASQPHCFGHPSGWIAVGLIPAMKSASTVELNAIVASTSSAAIHVHHGSSVSVPWSGLGRTRG